MKTGLVLGAGGVVGASWLVGALDALAAETDWDPGTADYIVGTSAGSVVGGICAAGHGPDAMSAYLAGQTLEQFAELERHGDALADRSSATRYELARGLPPIGPGSWQMAIRSLLNPRRHNPAVVLSAWLPRGMLSTEPIKELIESFVGDGWPDHPNYWAVACDHHSGNRVAFGRDGAPEALVRDAVAASCAIPAFYRPVRIDGRPYVDGGVCSMSNADLLCDRGLDLVVCLNPTSSRAGVPVRTPAERLAAAVRDASGRRLGREARKLRDAGTEVLLLQPSADDLAVMGLNLMARDRRVEVMEQARVSTRRVIAMLRDSGYALPASNGAVAGAHDAARPPARKRDKPGGRSDVAAA